MEGSARQPPSGVRKFPSFVDAFTEETAGTSSPRIFRTWAGIMAVSGALERKVKTYSRQDWLYPNLFAVLVGTPGVGKTVVIDVVRRLWRKIDVCVASTNVSKASLIDELASANRTTPFPNIESFNSLLVGSNELQNFLSAYESDFIGLLTEIYDCKDGFTERKRWMMKADAPQISIEHPSLTFVAGTTPSYLNNLFLDGAWDQGFASRTIFIYSSEVILGDIFISGPRKDYTDLVNDLKIINKLSGEYLWNEDAAVALTEWYKRGGPPIPSHPKLLHYRTRRHVQLIKLAMIAAASVSDQLVVELSHYQQALDWLLEAEVYVSDIFKASQGNDRKVIDDAWHYLYTIYIKENKKPIIAARLVDFISQRAPVHNVGRILEVLIKSGLINEVTEKVGRCYVPQPRADLQL